MAFNWRQLIPKLGPRWFTKDSVLNPDGTSTETDSRVLYAVYALFDAMSERLRLGIRARMPGLAPEDALAFIGRAYNILRGPNESKTSYETRLQGALDDKRVIGGPWAMMRQIVGYCSPNAVRVRIVNNAGTWFTLDRDGTRSVYENSAWNWDSTPAAWSRFWVLIYPTTGSPKLPWDRDGTWGDGSVWGDPTGALGTWGSTATAADVAAIQSIVRDWKPAGSQCNWILIVFNDGSFAPNGTSPPLPDGKWENDAKYDPSAPGRKIPSRDSNAIYWRGHL